MTDLTTHAPIIVSSDRGAHPYIVVPVDQLKSVTSILRNHHISFWEDSFAVSVNGTPEVVFVNFGTGVKADEIQRLLDSAE